jgi:chromosomal replication initiation ATPase DnaA
MKQPKQLTLELPERAALGREDFLVTDANALALQAVERWPDWPGNRLALVGETGAGKSHLVHVWANLSGGTVTDAACLDPGNLPTNVAVEDVDRLADLPPEARAKAEEALFHLYNAVLASNGTLLVTGRQAPARWSIDLPDLASRLQSISVVQIDPPDDALLAALLVKLFADRQLKVKPKLIAYLVPRIERTFAAAKEMVERLDREALAQGRKVNVALASDVLRGGPVTKTKDNNG